MTNNVITRLLRVLELEEKQNWRNRSVIGGLLAMGERWREDAGTEALDDNLVQVILSLMAHYETVNQQLRPQVANKIRAVLLGEVEDLDALLDELVGDRATTETASPSHPLTDAALSELADEEEEWDEADVEVVEDEHGAYAAYPPRNQPTLRASGYAVSSGSRSAPIVTPTIYKPRQPFSRALVKQPPKIWHAWAFKKWSICSGTCRYAMKITANCAPSIN